MTTHLRAGLRRSRHIQPRRALRLVGIVLLCATLAGCGSRTELFAALPENEANEMLAVLLNAGIGADKQNVKSGVSVLVDRDRVAQAITLLQSQGLPHDPHVTFGQMFRKDGLISSPVEERARYVYAMSEELSYTLSQIDGVLSARVHIVLPEQTSLDGTPQPSSAAVFIKYRPDSPLDTLQPQMRRLIADSIPALSPDKISFVFVPGLPPPAFMQAHPQTSARWRELLGLRVAADSYAPLAGTLIAAALVALTGLVGGGALAWRGRRRVVARVEPRSETVT
ncbi:type III secretion inner membrane ring lipoprotein SctJ [Paraburkholderia sediminicola]|uniref:type III secretion system inner membrane ring lipoprotein SctJ n=1 Tax=Paraburkholderia sediminicola TaxID=458836 RepID=UPI0038B70647